MFFVDNSSSIGANGGFLGTLRWRKSHRPWSRIFSSPSNQPFSGHNRMALQLLDVGAQNVGMKFVGRY